VKIPSAVVGSALSVSVSSGRGSGVAAGPEELAEHAARKVRAKIVVVERRILTMASGIEIYFHRVIYYA
tara:strand:- start:573 stop:779 length:207 start_codon:yes stop_codon:yes gene_type:complete